MAQFDLLILFPLLLSLIFVLFFYYCMTIKLLIPDFFGAKKFREKKLHLSVSFKLFKYILKVKSTRSYINALYW